MGRRMGQELELVRAGALALALMVLVTGTLASGQTQPAAPTEEAPDQYPALPYREDAFYFCSACHSFKLVAAQGMSRQRWDESLTWMVERHNMPDVQGEDRRKILDYLSAAFPERARPRGWKNPFAGD
jgi:hypothetical protein